MDELLNSLLSFELISQLSVGAALFRKPQFNCSMPVCSDKPSCGMILRLSTAVTPVWIYSAASFPSFIFLTVLVPLPNDLGIAVTTNESMARAECCS